MELSRRQSSYPASILGGWLIVCGFLSARSFYDESNAFSIDTRDSNSIHYAVSGEFSFTTLARDGLGGTGASSGFSFDTRTTAASGLAIVGPTSVMSGSQTEYHIVMNAPGGGTTDVTVNAFLAFNGPAPTYAGIGGTTLFVLRAAPDGALVQLIARYENAGGQVISAPLTVRVGQAFFAGMTAVPTPGGGPNYTVTLSGRASGGTGDYTYRWDTDGNGTYGDVPDGSPRSFEMTSAGGTYPMRLEVTDATNRKAYALKRVTLNKAPVANEPATRKPTYDIVAGTIRGTDGLGMVFDLNRKQNGLVLLTHGLYTDSAGSGSWLTDMAVRIADRLPNDPNVAIYDWTEYADPGGDVDPGALAALQILSAIYHEGGLFDAGKAALSEAVKIALHQATGDALAAAGLEHGGGEIALDARALAYTADFLIDAYFIRNKYPPAHGQYLAQWIIAQAEAGYIEPDAPVHLVGHSAGGFVLGECALWMEQYFRTHTLSTGKILMIDRITMLDTPFPYRSHLTMQAHPPTLPAPPVVERFVSSLYGGLEVPATKGIPSSANNRLDWLGTHWWLRFDPYDGGHGLSHRWYRRTIQPKNEADTETALLDSFAASGFNLSPLLDHDRMVQRPPVAAPGRVLADGLFRKSLGNAMSGFTTFGDVAEAGGVFTLTEEANAGITKPVTVPIGAYAVKFRFRFAEAGDGDFLTLHFGDDFLIYTGVDTSLSRAGFTEIEAPIEGQDGNTAALTFTLVSRGIANAAVEVAAIDFLVDPDPDGDGIATTQEQSAGTDPLRSDSDGDGLADGVEAGAGTDSLREDSDGDGQRDGAEITAGTNPLDSGSVFAVKEFRGNGSGFTLRWASAAGRIYRILRSPRPDFATFVVVATGLTGAEPTTTYTDATINASTTERVFYRVSLE